MNQRPEEQIFHRRDTLSFPQFQQLNPEICFHILSFVAAAPFEEEKDTSSTTTANRNDNERGLGSHVSFLTHSLPLVNKQFYQFSQDNILWKEALTRQAARSPELWKRGVVGLVRKLLPEQERQQYEESVVMSWSPAALVERLETLMMGDNDIGSGIGVEMYKRVLNTQIRFTGPIFAMPHPLRLGERYGLHFFEPRYRRLIAHVMEPFDDSARQGAPVLCNNNSSHPQDPPLFLHAHANVYRLTRDTLACLVQVQRCRIYDDGSADVLLLPVQPVRMEMMWEVPQSGNLYMGQGVRVAPGPTDNNSTT